MKFGSTSVRVDGLARGAACFDPLYIHPPLLAAAGEIIGADFKLSSFHGRSVLPCSAAQKLHQDFPRLADGWPMLGFIFMVDDFSPSNGATRFLVGSQSVATFDRLDKSDNVPAAACGPAGSMIVFNGSVWHGHGPNETSIARRSIQGAFIRRDQPPAVDFAA